MAFQGKPPMPAVPPVKPVAPVTPAAKPPAVTAPTPSAAERAVAALEGQGMKHAANTARDAAGIPRPPRTADEDFIATVHALIDKGGFAGFNSADVETSARWEALVKDEPAPPTRKYRTVRQSPTRFEVHLA